MEAKLPQLRKGGSGTGALMEPITKLLKSQANNEDWNPALRGSLRSAIACRQHPQSRVFAAGWADHSKCLFCLQNWSTLVQPRLGRRGFVASPGRCLAGGVVISDDVRLHEADLAAELTDPGAARLSKIRYKVEATP